MQQIKILPQEIINKIAAGEVVERPASVVKELLENSIDAGATEIKVKIEKGGNQLIEISDNGSGMDKANARLSLRQHATSKIKTDRDLYTISTMGFRGEALASIASVSDLSLFTFDGASQPVIVKLDKNLIISESASARKQGTTVTVRNIFFKIPARRKFLRSENTEYKYVLETFLALVLAKPQIGFQLIKDGKTVYQLTGVKTYAERIAQLFSQDKAGLLLPLNYSDSELKIIGLIGHPSLAKNYSQPQYIFLNERPIKDNLLGKAVRDGYSTTIMKGRYPTFFIYLSLKTDLFDINVHPRKSQAKFYQPQKIFYALKNSVAKALEKSLQQEFRAKLSQDSRLNYSSSALKSAEIAIKPKQIAGYHAPSVTNYSSLQSTGFSEGKPGSGVIKKSLEFTRDLLEPLHELTQTSFFQVFNTYLIIEKNNKLLIIDQHAADERVNYEKITKEFYDRQKIASIQLLLPHVLKISQKEKAILAGQINTLNKMGFIIEEFPGNELNIVEIPGILQGYDYTAALLEILHDLDERTNPKDALTKALTKMISTIACHASIKAGDKLSSVVSQQLIGNLFKCQLPYSCPHGRPIIWEINRSDLEKHFKRKL